MDLAEYVFGAVEEFGKKFSWRGLTDTWNGMFAPESERLSDYLYANRSGERDVSATGDVFTAFSPEILDQAKGGVSESLRGSFASIQDVSAEMYNNLPAATNGVAPSQTNEKLPTVGPLPAIG